MNHIIEVKAHRVQEIIRERGKLEKQIEKLNRELEELFSDRRENLSSPNFSVGKRVPISNRVFEIIKEVGTEGIPIKEIVRKVKSNDLKVRQSIAYLKKNEKISSIGWGIYVVKK